MCVLRIYFDYDTFEYMHSPLKISLYYFYSTSLFDLIFLMNVKDIKFFMQMYNMYSGK